MEREVFLSPPKEANTSDIWRLNKCVYGLSDASRSWYLRLREELLTLEATPNVLDQGLFYWFYDHDLIGVMAVFVDIISAGTKSWRATVMDSLKTTFSFGPYDERHNPITEQERTLYRTAIGQLNWVTGISRPEISFDVCLASTKVKSATESDMIAINKTIQVKNKPSFISYPMLDRGSLYLLTYTDASFNNLQNGGSQAGHLTLLCDQDGNCVPLSWNSSYKACSAIHSCC